MDEHCINCKFYKTYGDDEIEFGECRRFPPIAVDTFISDDGFAQPTTYGVNWCGEFIRNG